MIVESSTKSARCIGRSLASAARRPFSSSARIISRTATMRSASKNMCSVRQRPMPSAPNSRAVRASSGVSALARTFMRARRVGPAHQRGEIAGQLRLQHRHRALQHLPGGAVDGDDVARLQGHAAGAISVCACVVDADRAGAGDAGLAHAARHHRRVQVMPPRVVRMPSAACMPWMSSGQVSMRTRITLRPALSRLGLVGGEHDLAGGGARARPASPCAITLRSAFGSIVGCRSWSSAPGSMRRDRLLLRDQALVHELDRDAQRRLGGALAGAGLQHPELAALDGELDVLHVAVVLLEDAVDARRARRRPPASPVSIDGLSEPGLDARRLGDVLRRADAGDDVLALRVDQELAVERAARRSRDCG